MRHNVDTTAIVLACGAMLALGGCNSTSTSDLVQSLSVQEQGIQQSTMANLAMNQVIESSTKSLVDQDTGNATSTALMAKPAPRAAVSTVVDIGAMTRPDGTALFPNASGRFTLTTNGAVVNSWPTGANISTTRIVTIDFANNQGHPLVVTDPSSGITVTATSGTVTMDWSSIYTWTNAGNWVLNLDVTTTISPAVAMTATQGSTSTAVTAGGKRRVQTTMTRTTTVSPASSTLAVRRVISGDAANPRGGTPSSLTDWLVTGSTSGISTSIRWNRAADFTDTWNMLARTRTQAVATDAIYITYNSGFTFGPYSAAQVAATFKTTLQDTTAY